MFILDMHRSQFHHRGTAAPGDPFYESQSEAETEATTATTPFTLSDLTTPRTTISSMAELQPDAQRPPLFPPFDEEEPDRLPPHHPSPPAQSSPSAATAAATATATARPGQRPLPPLPYIGPRPLLLGALVDAIDLGELPRRWQPLSRGGVETHHHERQAAAAHQRGIKAALRAERHGWWRSGRYVDGAALQVMQESAEGFYEVQQNFFSKLAQAENEQLEHTETGFWGRGPHAERKQAEAEARVAGKRKDTVEALEPLLAYGPPRPARPARSTAARKKPAAHPAVPARGADHKDKAMSPTGNRMPPTPPMSPRRGDHKNDGDDEDVEQGKSPDRTPDTWRLSAKRVSLLFGFGSSTPRTSSSSDQAVK